MPSLPKFRESHSVRPPKLSFEVSFSLTRQPASWESSQSKTGRVPRSDLPRPSDGRRQTTRRNSNDAKLEGLSEANHPHGAPARRDRRLAPRSDAPQGGGRPQQRQLQAEPRRLHRQSPML